MPKIKTHSGTSKRFKITGSGKVVMRRACKRHLLTAKSAAKKMSFGRPVLVDPTKVKQIKLLLPYN